MVATGGGEDDDNTPISNINSNKSQFSISASATTPYSVPTSSTSPSTCTFSPVSFGRRMEEFWNDINLSSLHRNRHHLSTNNSNSNTTTAVASSGFRSFIFQDFLARDAAGESLHPASIAQHQHRSCSSRSSLLLNLNSGPDDQLNFSPPGRARMPSTTLDVPFDQVLLASVDSSPTLLGNNGGLRTNVPATEKSPGDRRHKRMIKNRESAARSRARKQAYTNELENELERLKEENSRLRKQQQQLRNAAAAAQLPMKKRSLQRTSTAPF